MTDARGGVAGTRGEAGTLGQADPLGQTQLRRVLATFPTGVAAVAAIIDGEPAGLAASSFVSVSLNPPLVSVCIGHSSTTWPVLHTAGRLGISVLGAHQETASRQLSSRDGERFAGIRWRATDNGAVLLHEASAWFECSIEREIPAGDHDIVLLRVHDLGASEALPLVFHGSAYRQLQVRGATAQGRDAGSSRSAGWTGRERQDERCRLGV